MTENDSEARIRWPIATAFFAYTLLIKLTPYILTRMDMQLDPGSSTYPWNFSPALAVCLFSGAFCMDRRVSIALPMITWLLSDLGIWAITGRFDWAFYPSQFAVYFCLLSCTTLGFTLRQNRSGLRTFGAGLSGCVVFFIVTNFATWATYDLYPHTLSGLIDCYVAAIPYFRNTLISMAFFGTLLFSPVCVKREQPASQPAASMA